jgi:hypothetical protein
MRKLVGAIALLALVWQSSCFSPREDLSLALKKHYSSLQWGDVDGAAYSVAPELADAFYQEWTKALTARQIAGYKLLRVLLAEEGKKAVVQVEFMLYAQNTMIAKKEIQSHIWERKNNIWKRTQ